MPKQIEVGSNIFEIIEFTLDRRLPDGNINTGKYGVNVAKVREVVRMPKINPLASQIKGIAGIFELRGIPIPAIHLASALGDEEIPVSSTQQIIVTEFSLKRAGFIVKSTEKIRRMGWEKILPPTADKKACISGMTLIENNEFLFILDLEKILTEIEIRAGYGQMGEIYGQAAPQGGAIPPQQEARVLTGPKILLVDDSSFALSNTKNTLEKMGYRVITATDGEKAKNFLESALEKNTASVEMVISDVEMPKMDGLSLTKWIRAQPAFAKIPVILHSSLSGDASQRAGKQVGADDYVVKHDLGALREVVAKFFKKAEPG
jgi:two-component system chemotaxis response regulator CheV